MKGGHVSIYIEREGKRENKSSTSLDISLILD